MFKHVAKSINSSLGLDERAVKETMEYLRSVLAIRLLFSQKIELVMKRYSGDNGRLAFALIALAGAQRKSEDRHEWKKLGWKME